MIETIYLVLHSHTDIGFTHDQPIVWDLHQRFIEEAVSQAEKDIHGEAESAFRWTIEAASTALRFLKNAPDSLITRFLTMEKAGCIEVTGMYADIAPLYDTGHLIETFQCIKKLRDDYGITISSAMNSDVNGQNWTLVDILKDLGIDGFSMAINTHFGRAPKPRPGILWWEGISGRRIMAYNGFTYGSVGGFGIGNNDLDIFGNKVWPQVQRHLDEVGYPIPVLMIQGVHSFGDNGTIVKNLGSYVGMWNKEGRLPKLVIATPRMWWKEVARYSDKLPVCRGDWTDSWNFGCISAARELSASRRNNVLLKSADALSAAVFAIDDKPEATRTAKSYNLFRDKAWESHNTYIEHTWGADCGIDAPDCEDTAAMWNHKAHYVYNVRSLALLLQRDALAEFSHFIKRPSDDDVLVFNSLPWERTISGTVPAGVDKPRGGITDTTAGRHFQDRKLDLDLLRGVHNKSMWGDQYPHAVLLPVKIEGFGYAVVPRTLFANVGNETEVSSKSKVENKYHCLTFDIEKGGITSWHDKRLNHEWVDSKKPFSFNCFVHERLADTTRDWPRSLLYDMNWFSDGIFPPNGWNPEWPAERSQACEVLSHKVFKLPNGIRVIQELKAKGCEGPLVQSVFLPDYDEYIEFDSSWSMGVDTHPQANYIYFPFNIKDPIARFDIGGYGSQPGKDQLEGVCCDYFTTQRWVDISNNEMGMTIATPENPMFMLGDFNFCKNQKSFEMKAPVFLGWVTNNYWETNFRAHQPGQVRARYRLLPHKRAFNETAAYKFGLEAAYDRPLMQQLGEKPLTSLKLPESGKLLILPSGENGIHIFTLSVKPDESYDKIIVNLLNAGKHVEKTEIKSGILKIVSAEKCDILGNPVAEIEMVEDAMTVVIEPGRVATLALKVIINSAANSLIL